MALLSPSGACGDERVTDPGQQEMMKMKRIKTFRPTAARGVCAFFIGINRAEMAEIFNSMQMLMRFDGKAQFRSATIHLDFPTEERTISLANPLIHKFK